MLSRHRFLNLTRCSSTTIDIRPCCSILIPSTLWGDNFSRIVFSQKDNFVDEFLVKMDEGYEQIQCEKPQSIRTDGASISSILVVGKYCIIAESTGILYAKAYRFPKLKKKRRKSSKPRPFDEVMKPRKKPSKIRQLPYVGKKTRASKSSKPKKLRKSKKRTPNRQLLPVMEWDVADFGIGRIHECVTSMACCSLSEPGLKRFFVGSNKGGLGLCSFSSKNVVSSFSFDKRVQFLPHGTIDQLIVSKLNPSIIIAYGTVKAHWKSQIGIGLGFGDETDWATHSMLRVINWREERVVWEKKLENEGLGRNDSIETFVRTKPRSQKEKGFEKRKKKTKREKEKEEMVLVVDPKGKVEVYALSDGKLVKSLRLVDSRYYEVPATNAYRRSLYYKPSLCIVENFALVGGVPTMSFELIDAQIQMRLYAINLTSLKIFELKKEISALMIKRVGFESVVTVSFEFRVDLDKEYMYRNTREVVLWNLCDMEKRRKIARKDVRERVGYLLNLLLAKEKSKLKILSSWRVLRVGKRRFRTFPSLIFLK